MQREPRERPAGDIHPKVAWGGGAALIVAGLLALLQNATGVAAPDGAPEFIVALIGVGVGYLKKGDGR